MTAKLREYQRKRNFSKTAEPKGEVRATRPARRGLAFVVQKHDASHLHYDVRLEIGGVMKSWAVPKGPSLDPTVKRLAVEVEDHPVAYNRFEGTIPEGEYGGGTVMLWDRGELVAQGPDGAATDLAEGYRAGRLTFTLRGERLRGAFTLTRMAARRGSDKPQWILFKRSDAYAEPGSDVTAVETTSVTTSRSMAQIADGDELPDETVLDQLARIEREGGDGELTFEHGGALAVTSLDRVVFPALGVTKGALMQYYVRAAPALLPLLTDRPLALRRYPNGVEGASFHQHEPKGQPPSVRTARVRIEDGTVHARLVGGDLPTLLYTLQLGAISVHPWLARVGSLASPDDLVLDLDPGPGVSMRRLTQVAHTVRAALAAHGLDGHPKTSGARGLHVLAPFSARTTWKAAASLAEAVARAVHAAAPKITTLERSPAKRPDGTVYVDHLQNARGKTVVSAWSVRARPEATVSTPLTWDEVTPALDLRAFTLDVALSRMPRP